MNQDELVKFLDGRRSEFERVAERFGSRFADDCVQEAFIKAASEVANFKGSSEYQLFGWVKRIVVNKCIDKLRLKSNQQHDELENVTPQTTEKLTPFEYDRLKDEVNNIHNALSELSPRAQDALTYHYLFGMTIRDTAEIMGEEVSALKGVLFRNVGKLRQKLSESQFSVMLRDG